VRQAVSLRRNSCSATIDPLLRSKAYQPGYRFSYDMLGKQRRRQRGALFSALHDGDR
jgi:hypothetical protein